MTPIIDRVAQTTGITKKLAREIVEEVFSSIVYFANVDGKVTIREFGRFEIKERKKRVNNTPIQGKPRVIPARRTLTFHCSPTLVEVI